MSTESEKLRQRYEDIACSGDTATTACDYRLRELEIDYGLEHIRDGDCILDVGCGPGVALIQYVKSRKVSAYGIDYAANMIEFARQTIAAANLAVNVDVQQASVLSLPFPDQHFDVVTSHRCLMALLGWEKQKSAITEIHRVLKPGGALVLMEGTLDGIERLNSWRVRFGLSEIDPAGRDRLTTLKFREAELLSFVSNGYELQRIQRWGMYYFLTRIIQPLLVAPDAPTYDHRINEVARMISKQVPDLCELGHLVGFSLRKRQTSEGLR